MELSAGTPLSTSGSRILAAIRAEFETTKRLTRFKIWRIVLPLATLVAYAMSCFIYVFVAPYSTTFGAATPKYLLENIDPTFFLIFQLAALFLVFDAPHRHQRNQIAEVLDAKPVSNFELLVGRVIATAALIWLLVVVVVLIPCLIGLIAAVWGFDFAEPIAIASVLNLLFLDAPTTLLYWCAFAVLLTSILQLRVAVFAVAAAFMFLWFFLTIESPYSVLSLVSPSSNDTLFISDLAPELVSVPVLLVRLATLLLAFAFVLLAAAWIKRNDVPSSTNVRVVAPLALVACAGMYGLASAMVFGALAEDKRWREFHVAAEEGRELDLKRISGTVKLDARSKLEIDMKLEFSADLLDSEPLVFAFNPAMNIQTLELNGSDANHTFQNGLLHLRNPNLLESNSDQTLRIVARGRPNPRFAYFDSAVNYKADPDVPIQTASLFGSVNSLYTPRYIALMPAICWYPIPGAINGQFMQQQHGSDYFDVDLTVKLSPSNLVLVGSGTTTAQGEEESTYHVKSHAPMREIGLFASSFFHMETEFDGMTIAMYFHMSHAKHLVWIDDFEQSFRSEVQEWLRRYLDLGLTLPQHSLSFVEAPRQLRTVGGGWRMDSVAALPGVVLVKEHGFPTAPLPLGLARIEEGIDDREQRKASQINLMVEYLARGLETDNLWVSLPHTFWSEVTSATGEYAQVLDQIARSLIGSIAPNPFQFFSIYSSSHIAHMTGVNPSISDEFLGAVLYGRPVPSPIQSFVDDYGRRASVWTYVESLAFSDLPTGDNQLDLELMLFKSNEIAKGLLSVNGEAKVFKWLTNLQREFAGSTYTYRDMLELANELELIVDPFLTDWIRNASLPGYVVSRMSVDRIADDAGGNLQYKTSVTVRNMEPVGGLVRLQYPTEETWSWMFPYYTQSDGVYIGAETSTRINLITPYEVRTAQLLPGLSMNRGAISLQESSSTIGEFPEVKPPPFAERSDWMPISERGIIVDDLDAGFTITQRAPNLARPTSIGPVGWFAPPRLQLELDSGLPYLGTYYARIREFRLARGTWGRIVESSAYGRYRKTVAQAWVKDTIHTARFTTELPEPAQWTLSFHVPRSWRPGPNLDLQWQFKISNDSQECYREFDVSSKAPGWNQIGDFDLAKGAISVELATTSKPGYVYADAIRWTRSEDP